MRKKKTKIVLIQIGELRSSLEDPIRVLAFKELSEKSAGSVALRAERIVDAECLSSDDLRVQINSHA